MATYIKIDTSNFKPFTFEDIIKPLVMQKENEDKFELALDEKQKEAALLLLLSQNDVDEEEYNTYLNYLNYLNSIADLFSKSGLAGGLGNKFRLAKNIYNTKISPIAARYTLREELKKAELALYDKDPSMLFAKPAATRKLGDYSNGMPLSLHVSGNALKEDAAKFALSISLSTYGDPIISPSAINLYYLFKQQGGLTKERMLELIKSENGIVQNYIEDVRNKVGYDKYNEDELNAIDTYIYEGLMLGAVQTQQVKELRNLSISARALNGGTSSRVTKGGKKIISYDDDDEDDFDPRNDPTFIDNAYGGKLNKFPEGGDTNGDDDGFLENPNWNDSIENYYKDSKKDIRVYTNQNGDTLEGSGLTNARFMHKFGVLFDFDTFNALPNGKTANSPEEKVKAAYLDEFIKTIKLSLDARDETLDVSSIPKIKSAILRASLVSKLLLARRQDYVEERYRTAKSNWENQNNKRQYNLLQNLEHWNTLTLYTNPPQKPEEEEEEFNEETLQPWSKEGIKKRLINALSEKGLPSLSDSYLNKIAERIMIARDTREAILDKGHTEQGLQYGSYRGLGYEDYTTPQGNLNFRVMEVPYSTGYSTDSYKDLYDDYRNWRNLTEEEKEVLGPLLISGSVEEALSQRNAYFNAAGGLDSEGNPSDDLVVASPYTKDVMDWYTVENDAGLLRPLGIPESTNFGVKTYNSSGEMKTPGEIAEAFDDSLYDTITEVYSNLIQEDLEKRRRENLYAPDFTLYLTLGRASYEKASKGNSPFNLYGEYSPYTQGTLSALPSTKGKDKINIDEAIDFYTEVVPQYMDAYNARKNIIGTREPTGRVVLSDVNNFLDNYSIAVRNNDFRNIAQFNVGDRALSTVRFNGNDLLSNPEALHKVESAITNALGNGTLKMISGPNMRPKFDKDFDIIGKKVHKELLSAIKASEKEMQDTSPISRLEYEPLTGNFIVTVNLLNTSATTTFESNMGIKNSKKDGDENTGLYKFTFKPSALFPNNLSDELKEFYEYVKQYRQAIADHNPSAYLQSSEGLTLTLRDKLLIKFTNTQTEGPSGIGHTQSTLK